MISFDDLIAILSNKVSENKQLASQIRCQYPAAMVDEFQDTDPQQFNILQALFSDHAQPEDKILEQGVDRSNDADIENASHQIAQALYLIGDPKQAIYGFRGGDIFTYLSARGYCQYHWVMDTNWRSSVEMIQGYNRLFYGNDLSLSPKDVFGFNIPYLPVNPSPKAIASKEESKAFTDNTDKALQFVYFHQGNADTGAKPSTKANTKVKAGFRANMATWCAQKISFLINDNNSAADIAILVRDGTEAQEIKQALEDENLTSVYLSNRANLWQSEQTSQLIRVLKGVLYLENDRYFVAALASGLLGYDHDKLIQAQSQELIWQELKFQFKALRDEWEYKGFISTALKLLHQHINVTGRYKDRVLTNLLHLFELLQAASQKHRQPQELLYWFEQQQIDNTDNLAELRLESDENLIKIVTQHGAKGLEYPVVFVPFASRHKDPLKVGLSNVTVITSHNAQGSLETSLGGNELQLSNMANEAYAETVRLLYVAVTRAEKRCYMLMADFDRSHLSPLGKTMSWQEGAPITETVIEACRQYSESIGLESIDVTDNGHAEISIPIEDGMPVDTCKHDADTLLSLPRFTAKIERDWWLSSFSALSKNMRHGGVSLPDRDEVQAATMLGEQEQENHLIQFGIAKGAQTGNLLHDLLEHGNYQASCWQNTIDKIKHKYASVLLDWPEAELEQWLLSICQTPFINKINNTNSTMLEDSKSEGGRLNALSSDQLLKESEFYFPMENADSNQLSTIMYQHRKRIKKDQSLDYVRLPPYRTLKGMMHGFIDLVFEYDGKYYVCDYKSTHLGDHFSHYQHEGLQNNIFKSYYDLQYLIYSLALHRHLKARLADYDPARDFGGVYYLYLRGMKADSADTGVFYTDITEDELTTLDKLFRQNKDEIKPSGTEANV